MRAVLSLLLVALVALPGAAHAALTLPPLDPPPVVHATLDTSAYRANVSSAVAWTMRFQKPDGGVYEYEFLQRDSNAVDALILWAHAPWMDVRGANMSALIRYFEESKAPDGSWGSGYLVADVTASTLEGLLTAGYDPSATNVQRALTWTKLRQQSDGHWRDSAGNDATYLTAQNVRVLLLAGSARSDDRVERAVEWLLHLQDPATGGFGPTPDWFTTPAATALVLDGLLAYLAAPATGAERLAEADVERAAGAAVAHLGATYNWDNRKWAYSTGSNALIVGPASRYHAERGLPLPDWLWAGAQHLLDRQRADGAITNDQGTPMLGWTLIAARSLLEVPRDLRRHDTIEVQATWNDGGTYGAGPVRVTLIDAQGVVRGAYEGPAGPFSLSWRHLPMGEATLRVEAPGATPFETRLLRLQPVDEAPA